MPSHCSRLPNPEVVGEQQVLGGDRGVGFELARPEAGWVLVGQQPVLRERDRAAQLGVGGPGVRGGRDHGQRSRWRVKAATASSSVTASGRGSQPSRAERKASYSRSAALFAAASARARRAARGRRSGRRRRVGACAGVEQGCRGRLVCRFAASRGWGRTSSCGGCRCRSTCPGRRRRPRCRASRRGFWKQRPRRWPASWSASAWLADAPARVAPIARLTPIIAPVLRSTIRMYSSSSTSRQLFEGEVEILAFDHAQRCAVESRGGARGWPAGWRRRRLRGASRGRQTRAARRRR